MDDKCGGVERSPRVRRIKTSSPLAFRFDRMMGKRSFVPVSVVDLVSSPGRPRWKK